jgi:dihydropteroate synthase
LLRFVDQVIAMHWQTSRFRIDLSHPLVMGIVNVTPDSFAGDGAFVDPDAAIELCARFVAEGADMLDIGGESTRPGAMPVALELELARVIPVLDAAVALGCPVSVDTSKPEVMAAALAHGADIVNDINALQAPGALDVVAAHPSCGICLMHKRGIPESMQLRPHYDDVLKEVGAFLHERASAALLAGVARERIVVDPGIGFGKTVEHNLELLRRQRELLSLGWPLLVGWSRKSTLGVITGRGVTQRQTASVTAALAAVQAGASVVRVHDVSATVDALKVWRAAGHLMRQ